MREFTLTTFGGSGSLLLCRLMDILSIKQALVPINPASLSAFGLLTVDVKNDYVRTAVARHNELDVSALATLYDSLEAQAAAALDREGFASSRHRLLRSADLRYFGQAYEVRVPVPDGRIDAAAADLVAAAFHRAHRAVYGYDFVGDEGQPVEWVNLRVTGVGPIAARGYPISRPGRRPLRPDIARCVSTVPSRSIPRSTGGPISHPVSTSTGRPSSRTSARPCPSTPASGRTLIRSAI